MVADKPSISSASHFRALRWFTEQEAAVSLSSFIPEASSRIDEEAPPTTDPLEARKKPLPVMKIHEKIFYPYTFKMISKK